MKHVAAGFLLILAILTPASAGNKPKVAFNHLGEIVAHGQTTMFGLADRSDLFYSGDYVCLPGDEHHSPDCRLYRDWLVIDKFGYSDITLDDGRKVVVCFHPLQRQHESWPLDEHTTVIRSSDEMTDMVLLGMRWEGAPDGSYGRFHYGIDASGRIWIKGREPKRPDGF